MARAPRNALTGREPAIFVVLWSFDVAPDRRAAFEEHYGPAGPWRALYFRSPEFVSASLLCGGDPSRYVTVDRWRSREAYHGWKESFREEYLDLNRRDSELAGDESCLGFFEEIPEREAR